MSTSLKELAQRIARREYRDNIQGDIAEAILCIDERIRGLEARVSLHRGYYDKDWLDPKPDA